MRSHDPVMIMVDVLIVMAKQEQRTKGAVQEAADGHPKTRESS